MKKNEPAPWISGDMVFVNRFVMKKSIQYFRPGFGSIKIKGFVCELPFFRQWFYGAGYDSKRNQYIYVKRRWHYYPAKFCEWARRLYYNRLEQLIFKK